MPPVPRTFADLIVRRRPWLVAALVALAVAAALHSLAPSPGRVGSIVVAAHDLRSGLVIGPADVALESVPVADLPSHGLTATAGAVGHSLAGPVRRGEPLTDFNLLGPSLARAVGPGRLAVALHVADATTLAALVRPGDRVDVFAAAADQPPTRLAVALPVLAVPGKDADDAGGVVIVAAMRTQALALAGASSEQISVAVRA